MFATIQRLIESDARLHVAAANLTPHADLYALGLTPYSAVRLLLSLEREFDAQLPRDLLTRETMRSIDSISQALRMAQRAGHRDAA
ncbi:MAG: acyl carrier protein [Methylocystis sp.]|nr:MAG: acyl carrier protein [Methylocystis sp.]